MVQLRLGFKLPHLNYQVLNRPLGVLQESSQPGLPLLVLPFVCTYDLLEKLELAPQRMQLLLNLSSEVGLKLIIEAGDRRANADAVPCAEPFCRGPEWAFSLAAG